MFLWELWEHSKEKKTQVVAQKIQKNRCRIHLRWKNLRGEIKFFLRKKNEKDAHATEIEGKKKRKSKKKTCMLRPPLPVITLLAHTKKMLPRIAF